MTSKILNFFQGADADICLI